MKDILLLVAEATLNALKQAKAEALKLKQKLDEEIKSNETLNTLLDGISIRQGFDGGKTSPKRRPMPLRKR